MEKKNLEKAMENKRITYDTLATLIGVTKKTLYNKIHGKSEFYLKEAMAIRDNVFPEYTLNYLFCDA